MGHVKVSVPIDAPIDLAWKIATDLERYPEWQAQILEITDVIGRYPEVGSSFVSLNRLSGRTMEYKTQVTAVDPPRRMVQDVTMPGGHATFTSWFEPAAGGGLLSTFEAEYELPGGFFGTIADRLFFERGVERSVRHTQENLKALVEAQALVPA